MDVIFLKSLRPLYCDYISRILCVRRAQQRRPPRPPFMYFYSRPSPSAEAPGHFYSRPYARGDRYLLKLRVSDDISTRAPTRGATRHGARCLHSRRFLLAPLREGRPALAADRKIMLMVFLLAPLREGRPWRSTASRTRCKGFLLAPLREGRPH